MDDNIVKIFCYSFNLFSIYNSHVFVVVDQQYPLVKIMYMDVLMSPSSSSIWTTFLFNGLQQANRNWWKIISFNSLKYNRRKRTIQIKHTKRKNDRKEKPFTSLIHSTQQQSTSAFKFYFGHYFYSTLLDFLSNDHSPTNKKK